MPHRCTASTLIKSAALALVVCVLAGLCLSSWDAFDRLNLTHGMSASADATAGLLKATGSEQSPTIDLAGQRGLMRELGVALDAARRQAALQHAVAQRSLVLQLALLASAFTLVLGCVLVANRRVVTPVHTIGNAVLKPAVKDFTGRVSVPQPIDDDIAEFEHQVRQALSQLSGGSNPVHTTPAGMSALCGEADDRVEIAAETSNPDAMNLQNVAFAVEELNASIADIRRRGAPADKIGEAVCSINDVACQTNLLALHGILRAERAGEGGRGFAAAASEVDSLASLTAKVTDDVSQRVAEIVAALAAIKEQDGDEKGMTQRTDNLPNGIVCPSADAGTAAQEVNTASARLGARTECRADLPEGFLGDLRTA